MIKKKTYARIGLMGNPSDGFYGKTLSTCITNFYAEVKIRESKMLRIIPHAKHDPISFSSLGELEEISHRDGYYGGIRLIFAACKKFSQHCREENIRLDDRNYAISYDTKIPRQVGLGGSSAIIVSLFKVLMEFYGLTDADIPLELQPNLILSVETEELGINAGLQDRVIQTYGGTVFMDFNKAIMDECGHGIYKRMDSELLPDLFLAWISSSGKDSGKMHNQTRFRFNQGDPAIIEAMAEFAGFAVSAKEALESGDYDQFGKLMNMNFDLRREIYGDDVIGEKSLEMIQIARDLGAPAKFPGSGGAVIGMYGDQKHFQRLEKAYMDKGYNFGKIHPQKGV